jgi:hypothetical protein
MADTIQFCARDVMPGYSGNFLEYATENAIEKRADVVSY